MAADGSDVMLMLRSLTAVQTLAAAQQLAADIAAGIAMAAATDAVAAYGTAKTAYDDRQDGVRWCPDRGDRRDALQAMQRRTKPK